MSMRGDDYPYDDYGFEKYEENKLPLAYLLTFSTYGTWLHGDTQALISGVVTEDSVRSSAR